MAGGDSCHVDLASDNTDILLPFISSLEEAAGDGSSLGNLYVPATCGRSGRQRRDGTPRQTRAKPRNFAELTLISPPDCASRRKHEDLRSRRRHTP